MQQCEAVLDDLVDTDRLPLCSFSLKLPPDPADHLAGAAVVFDDVGQNPADSLDVRCFVIQIAMGRLRVTQNCRQRLVEFMRQRRADFHERRGPRHVSQLVALLPRRGDLNDHAFELVREPRRLFTGLTANAISLAARFGIATNGFRLAVPRTSTGFARRTDPFGLAIERFDAELLPAAHRLGPAIPRFRAALEDIGLTAADGLAAGVAAGNRRCGEAK